MAKQYHIIQIKGSNGKYYDDTQYTTPEGAQKHSDILTKNFPDHAHQIAIRTTPMTQNPDGSPMEVGGKTSAPAEGSSFEGKRVVTKPGAKLDSKPTTRAANKPAAKKPAAKPVAAKPVAKKPAVKAPAKKK